MTCNKSRWASITCSVVLLIAVAPAKGITASTKLMQKHACQKRSNYDAVLESAFLTAQ